MAARKNKVLHDDKTKLRIRASQLLNRLNDFANGTVEMSAAQVNAARIVIGKVIPDLKAIAHTGQDRDPVNHSLVVEFVAPTKHVSLLPLEDSSC